MAKYGSLRFLEAYTPLTQEPDFLIIMLTPHLTRHLAKKDIYDQFL